MKSRRKSKESSVRAATHRVLKGSAKVRRDRSALSANSKAKARMKPTPEMCVAKDELESRCGQCYKQSEDDCYVLKCNHLICGSCVQILSDALGDGRVRCRHCKDAVFSVHCGAELIKLLPKASEQSADLLEELVKASTTDLFHALERTLLIRDAQCDAMAAMRRHIVHKCVAKKKAIDERIEAIQIDIASFNAQLKAGVPLCALRTEDSAKCEALKGFHRTQLIQLKAASKRLAEMREEKESDTEEDSGEVLESSGKALAETTGFSVADSRIPGLSVFATDSQTVVDKLPVYN